MSMRQRQLRIKFSTRTECSLSVIITFLIFWVPEQQTEVQEGRDSPSGVPRTTGGRAAPGRAPPPPPAPPGGSGAGITHYEIQFSFL